MAVLLFGVGGVLWWTASPAPSEAAFASALRSDRGSAPSADLLCLDNLPYDHSQIVVQAFDSNTRRWMDALTKAGLYSAGQPLQSSYQRLIQYAATPELAKWRHGTRLCFGTSWSVSSVKAGRLTPETLGAHRLFRARAVWKAEGGGPWVQQLDGVLNQVPGVTLEGGSITTESNHVFELRNHRWVALRATDVNAIQSEILETSRRTGTVAAAAAPSGGMFASLMGLFSGLGAAHPLVGEWAIDDSSPLGLFGASLPFNGGRISFGRDYMESGGERVKARFQVSGNVVTVSAEGESGTLRFTVKDRNSIAMDMGLAELPLKRIR